MMIDVADGAECLHAVITGVVTVIPDAISCCSGTLCLGAAFDSSVEFLVLKVESSV